MIFSMLIKQLLISERIVMNSLYLPPLEEKRIPYLEPFSIRKGSFSL